MGHCLAVAVLSRGCSLQNCRRGLASCSRGWPHCVRWRSSAERRRVLWRRVYHPGTLPPSDFRLGRWGIPVNAMAVIYSFWAFFWCFWPEATPVDASGFNWSSPIFVSVLIIAMIVSFAIGSYVSVCHDRVRHHANRL